MKSDRIQWIELDRSALSHNLRQFRSLIGKRRKLLAMVKANAYGHGMLETARMAVAGEADWLGVHSFEEGIALRDAGLLDPVLVVGYVPLASLEEAVRQDLRFVVYNRETVLQLEKICQKLDKQAYLHLKVETGTYRQGIEHKTLFALANDIQSSPCLVLEGLSSHFANIEDTTDHSYARFQLKNFQENLTLLDDAGIQVPLKHMSCSAAAILFPKTHFDMVRVGIGLYGLWPSRETYVSCLMKKKVPIRLRPVLSWKSRIAQLKTVPSGAFLGYGCTYRTTRRTRLALVPVGYYDGYPRDLSNVAHVLVKGQRAPLRGRVAMNFFAIDVTDIPGVKLEEEVVLLGKMDQDELSAETMAGWAGTINYEIVARINPQIPRIVK
ncbi:MAG: alanine racemase [Candidatus Aminicenantes bacterium]|nr:alanine racemase [Candidatus Aminicenantes bacterium]